MKHIHILGGGPAGLAAAYYAHKNGIKYSVYEASPHFGGNCRTLNYKDFLFDTGAHRFHDKNEKVTNEIKELLGEKLKKISAPSRIYSESKFIDFPLTPLNLWKSTGTVSFLKSSLEVLTEKFKNSSISNFEEFAISTYGETTAKRFLLDYSEKLWGCDCKELSKQVAGKRLNGLNLKTFILEAIKGAKSKTKHVDGEFYYPEKGIGEILSTVCEKLDPKNLNSNSAITGLYHNGKKLTEIEINRNKRVPVDFVINTLPISLSAKLLKPESTSELLSASQSLRYRNVLLVLILLDKSSVSNDATLYFPSKDFIFTRVYEPRNRSIKMSPYGKTSLVAEIPCYETDDLWTSSEAEITGIVKEQIISTGLIERKDISDIKLFRIKNAYPVIDMKSEEVMSQMFEAMNQINNMRMSGRCGKFLYSHIHDHFIEAKNLITEISNLNFEVLNTK